MQLLEIIDKLCDCISNGKYSQDVKELIFSHKILVGKCFEKEWECVDKLELQKIEVENASFATTYLHLLESMYSNIMVLTRINDTTDIPIRNVSNLLRQTNELIFQVWKVAAQYHTSNGDSNESSSDITPFDVVFFIITNAAVTLLQKCLLCINKWQKNIQSPSHNDHPHVNQQLFTDSVASLLTIRGSIYSMQLNTKDVLDLNIHEITYLLQSQGRTNRLGMDNSIETMPIALSKSFVHCSYFHAILNTHTSLPYQLNNFYQEVQDELAVVGYIIYTGLPRGTMTIESKGLHRNQSNKWRDYLEQSMMTVYISLTKFWDASNTSIKSPTTGSLNPITYFDLLISHSILCSFSPTVWQWKDPSSGNLESSFLVQPSALVAIIAIATKLADSYEEDNSMLGLHLLYQLFLCTSSSVLSSIVEWITPKLFQIHSIASGEWSKLYSHRVLQVVLTVSSSQSSLIIQYQHKYLQSITKDSLHEYDPTKVWIMLFALEPCVEWYPKIMIATHFSELMNGLMHSCNIWHVPIQSIALRVIDILFKRFPKVPILTEMCRMLLFYNLNLVPDISTATNEQVLEIRSQLMESVRTIRNDYRPHFDKWSMHLRQTSSKAQELFDSDLVKGGTSNTIELILEMINSLE